MTEHRIIVCGSHMIRIAREAEARVTVVREGVPA